MTIEQAKALQRFLKDLGIRNSIVAPRPRQFQVELIGQGRRIGEWPEDGIKALARAAGLGKQWQEDYDAATTLLGAP